MTQGPNVKRLIAHKISLDAIPVGGGFIDGIKFLRDPVRVLSAAKEATAWVEAAIQAVRDAGEPNPWRESSDDEIAEELLRQVDTRKAKERAEKEKP